MACEYGFKQLIFATRSVVETLRLADGTLFPMPINLDIARSEAERLGITAGSRVVLRDPRDDAPLAIISGKSSISDMSPLTYLQLTSGRYLFTGQGQRSRKGLWCR